MSGNDRVQASGTQKLMREVQQLSGWGAEKLSREFYKCGKKLDISGGLIRQYLSGRSSASLRRRRDIALAAQELGCYGHECGQTLYWAWATFELRSDKVLSVFSRRAKETKKATKKLEQALGELIALGYDKSDILASVEMKLLRPGQQLDEVDERFE